MKAKWLAVCALILACGSAPVLAQSGFVLFGGEKDADNNLTYSMINNRSKARLNLLDLQLKPKNVAIAEIRLDYSYFYDNSFDTSNVQVIDESTRQAVEVEKIETDKIDDVLRVMNIVLKKPVPAETPLKIRFQNFTNPRSAGTFKIQARYLGTEPNPIYRYAGSWYISFN
ncbi:DUF2808 domain-containing protein [Gloeobacter kilaueensis]|uniref:DUF2808 domain-containing protein n=1 Tax=Gloeobacter kilaueensis (strain ATCC BAA-2537 / CCAP 1431/1 / ULC 316 / JS1) TaxID=1183438 RepID=U5QH07_GLOK1|nr:DUF2808 domain-containing protein [Gloeobacter kilaueensis]AGY56889.1 hypothetical protein GKIL_0643 [Gloeobacter kilaueensis JS1]